MINHGDYDICPKCDLGKADSECIGFQWRDEFTPDTDKQEHRMKNPAKLRFKNATSVFVADLKPEDHELVGNEILKLRPDLVEHVMTTWGEAVVLAESELLYESGCIVKYSSQEN